MVRMVRWQSEGGRVMTHEHNKRHLCTTCMGVHISGACSYVLERRAKGKVLASLLAL